MALRFLSLSSVRTATSRFHCNSPNCLLAPGRAAQPHVELRLLPVLRLYVKLYVEAPPPKPRLTPGQEPASVKNAFAELEKFWAQVMTSEKAAKHPEIQKQVNFMKTSQEKIALAQFETLVARKAHEAQVSTFQEKCRQAEDAILKKREEIATPGLPLDGNALGLALVKDLRPPRRAESGSARRFRFERVRFRRTTDPGTTERRSVAATSTIAPKRTVIVHSKPSTV